MAEKDLEALYSPSSWSKRLSKDVIVQEHVRVTTDISRQVRASIKYTTHYYGQGSNEKLDIFQEKAEAPILVYFSGGYWQELSGDISAYPVRSFHEENVTVIVVHYDRAPKVTLPQIVQQAINATKLVVDYAHKNNVSKIFLSGHSAGSHLCSMILGSSWFENLELDKKCLVKGVFHLSGIFDLRPLVSTSINDNLNLDQDSASVLSPWLQEDIKVEGSFLSYFIVAENDSPAFKSQASNMVQKMLDSGLKQTKLEVIENTDHFDLVEKLSQKEYKLTQLMLTYICQ